MLRFLDQCLEEIVAGTGLVVMTGLVFAQAVMRYAFNAPMSWPDEIATYCMIWSVYLSASWAVRERSHVRVLNLSQMLPEPFSLWFIGLSDLIWLGVSLFICWQGILLFVSLDQQRYVSPVLGIDQKWPYLVIAVGFGLIGLRLIQIYYRCFRYGEPVITTQTNDSENRWG